MTETIASVRHNQREANDECFWGLIAHMRISRTVAWWRLSVLVGLVVTSFACGAQVPQPSQSGSGNEYTLRLNSNLVILSATVLDRQHAPVSGLDRDDFQIYEDGALQKIRDFSHEDIPVAVGILVDNSASMAPKRNDVIAAALAFARSSNPQDQMFVVNFNDSVSFGLPPDEPFTDRQEQLERALSAINTIGQTSLYDGIAAGLDHLRQANRDKRVLILISDGGDDASTHALAQVLAMATQSSAVIYAIGIFDEQDGDQNPSVLKRFAKETGGEAFFPESSKDIFDICEGIARDIRNQYTLTYVPRIASQDGKYRAIVVKASGGNRGRLSVRTRAGYSVPPGAPESGSKGAQP